MTLPYNADLTNVDLSGGSEFHSEYGLDGEKIEVDLSGGSEFYCDLHADEIELDLSGGSEFFGNVEADEIDMELSGASNIMKKVVGSRYALVCDKCEGVMSGGSEMHYTGNAATTGSDCTGGSEISHDVL